MQLDQRRVIAGVGIHRVQHLECRQCHRRELRCHGVAGARALHHSAVEPVEAFLRRKLGNVDRYGGGLGGLSRRRRCRHSRGRAPGQEHRADHGRNRDGNDRSPNATRLRRVSASCAEPPAALAAENETRGRDGTAGLAGHGLVVGHRGFRAADECIMITTPGALRYRHLAAVALHRIFTISARSIKGMLLRVSPISPILVARILSRFCGCLLSTGLARDAKFAYRLGEVDSTGRLPGDIGVGLHQRTNRLSRADQSSA